MKMLTHIADLRLYTLMSLHLLYLVSAASKGKNLKFESKMNRSRFLQPREMHKLVVCSFFFFFFFYQSIINTDERDISFG